MRSAVAGPCGLVGASRRGSRATRWSSLGDSAISGEAGRWAGNTNGASSRTDALGPTAYHDVAGARVDPRLPPLQGRPRSTSAAAWTALNLACSGARTYTRTSDGKFKPGIDFYSAGGQGQARRCRSSRRRDKNIKAVVVLIGANDYGFADIVQTCVTNWLTSPSWWKNYCRDDSSMVSMFSAANITKNTTAVRGAFKRIKQAMAAAAATTTSPSTRSSPRPTRRRSRAAPASATPRRASRARRSAAAASGTATPTGRATPSSTR